MSHSSPEPEDPVEAEADVLEEEDAGRPFLLTMGDYILQRYTTNGEYRLSQEEYDAIPPPPRLVPGTSANQGRFVRLPNLTYRYISGDADPTNPTNPSSISLPSAPDHSTAFTSPDAAAPPGGAPLAIPLDERVQSASGSLAVTLSLVENSRQLLGKSPADKRPFTATGSGGSDTGESNQKRPRTHDEERETPPPAPATTAEPSSVREGNTESIHDLPSIHNLDAPGLPFVSFSVMPSSPPPVDPNTEDWRANWTAGDNNTTGLAVPTGVARGDDIASSQSDHLSLLSLSLDSSPRAPESPKDDAGQAA